MENTFEKAKSLFIEGLDCLLRSNYAQAEQKLREALVLVPDRVSILINLSAALLKQGKIEESKLFAWRSIELDPGNPQGWINYGQCFAMQRKYSEALKHFDKAISINPNSAEARLNIGNVFRALHRLDNAVENFQRAIELNSDYVEAYNNLGVALSKKSKYDNALASYERAIALNPDYAESYYNRGNLFMDLKMYEEALASYKQSYALKPDIDYLPGSLISTRMRICDWSRIDIELPKLFEKIVLGENVVHPFTLLSLTTDLSIQCRATEDYAAENYPEESDLGPIQKSARGQRIRIGYFSADFRDHPVSILMAEFFELHDRSKFELYGFSFGPDDRSEMRDRVKKAFKKFFDVEEECDMEVARLSRKLGIDIAIDLGGFTANNRAVGAFSYRAAPVQLSYVGYLGTMGAPYYDYLIADKTIIPQESAPYYSEKILYLPCYQVNDSKRHISDRMFTREELGLPDTGFVFCCFNNNYKIQPKTFDSWMRILRSVRGSVLFLYAETDLVARNLKNEAERRGVDSSRLVFGGRLETSEYLARYRVADLFLDTLPYNAGTTASDALWAGLPVLTQTGESFASRMAASLLNAIGLPELITSSHEGYEALAIELATNPGKLSSIKQKLEQNRSSHPLFDSALFTKNIENMFTLIHERYLAGLAPNHIHVGSYTNESHY